MNEKPILSVRNLEISFSQYTKGLKRIDSKAINNLDIDLYKGEILAVVGSSGSGKSLLAHSILGILPSNAQTKGSIIYKDEILDEENVNLNKENEKEQNNYNSTFIVIGIVVGVLIIAFIIYMIRKKKK